MHAYFGVSEIAPASCKKFFLSPYFFFFFFGGGGGGDQREPVCHLEKNIRFQTNMATRVLHASIFQTFIFHY